MFQAEKANWIQPQMTAPSAGLMPSLSEEVIGFIWCPGHSCEVVELSTAPQPPPNTHAFKFTLPSLQKCLRWHLGQKVWNTSVFFPGKVLSQWVFVCRKWSTGSTPSGQPGSTTYRWPSPGPMTRRWGGHGDSRGACCRGNRRWFCWNCDGLFKSPSLLKGHLTSDCEHAFIFFLFFFSCSWCPN